MQIKVSLKIQSRASNFQGENCLYIDDENLLLFANA